MSFLPNIGTSAKVWCVLGSPPTEVLLLWKGHYREELCLYPRHQIRNMCCKDVQSRCTEDPAASMDLLLRGRVPTVCTATALPHS